MIYSGLDWSGSPGPAHGSWLVFAVVHLDEKHLLALDAALALAKQNLRVPPAYVFRHNGASARTRSEFFASVERVSLTSHVYMLDKARWAAQQIGRPTGPDCIQDGVVTLIAGCPASVVAGMILYVDLPPEEGTMIARYRTEIRRALRDSRPRRTGFKNVRPCPDHRLQGGIIQVADMIAGEVRERGGLHGPHLARLGASVRLV